MQVGRRILRTALIAGSALGLTAGGSFLALASGPAAQASTTCAAAWSSTTVYTVGEQGRLLEGGAVDLIRRDCLLDEHQGAVLDELQVALGLREADDVAF